jgi:hypothetical protein
MGADRAPKKRRALQAAENPIRTVGRGIQTVGRGIRTVGRGIQTVGRGIRAVGRGIQTVGRGIRAVGRGFIPGIKPIKSMWASAPEVRFSSFSPDIWPFPAAC